MTLSCGGGVCVENMTLSWGGGGMRFFADSVTKYEIMSNVHMRLAARKSPL